MTRNDKIIARLKRGQSYGQIAVGLRISRNVVAGVAHRAGIKTGRRWNGDQQSAAMKAAWASKSAAERSAWGKAAAAGRWRTNTPAEA